MQLLSSCETNLRIQAHNRTVENFAQLEVAFAIWCEYATGIGAVPTDEAESLRAKIHDALIQAATVHRRQQESVNPAKRFLEILTTLISSNRVYIGDQAGDSAPAEPALWGWKAEGGSWKPSGDCVGWTKNHDLYLDPDASLRPKLPER